MAKTDQAIIAETKPAKVDLKAGEKYFWCACGRSATQPFCDGSHRVTTITSLTVSVEEDSEAFLCQCKARVTGSNHVGRAIFPFYNQSVNVDR